MTKRRKAATKPPKGGVKVTTPPKTKRKTNYLNNKDLLAEVLESKSQKKMTDKLAKMLQLLTAKYAKKGNFASYTYNDDMQAYAMMSLVKTWNSFNPQKSKNPFAFFTQCIKNSFIQYLNTERRHRDLRDVMLVDKGLTPSYTYQMMHAERAHVLHEEGQQEQAESFPDSNKEENGLLTY